MYKNMEVSNAEKQPLRWGIMGCGLISADFVHAVLRKSQQPHVIRAVATSNSVERAQAFLTKLQVPNREQFIQATKAYGSYDELLADPEIEIIYLGILNETHCRWVCACLDHGKHVLCEKPMGLSKAEAEMIEAKAREKQLFCMEGFWTRFFPANKKLQDIIEQNKFGAVKVINANLGLMLPPSRFRLDASECPAIDIGCYPVMFALLCLQDEEPSAVRALAVKNAEGVDIAGTFFLEFPSGATASLMYTTQATCTNPAFVSFERGTVVFPDFFYCPTRVRVIDGSPDFRDNKQPTTEQELHFPLQDDASLYNFPNTSGLRYEADHVFECLRAGLLQSPVVPLRTSVRIAGVMEEIRRQIGIEFPAQDRAPNKCNV